MTQYPEANLLANALSPYLRQHGGNPVHWRAWGDAAFHEAKALKRPILLSIGYAACHWCHVMAHESFEDAETAALMNRHFVNVKVDREERPDVDQIYMTALQAMGEQGGWPLTMFLTPDGRPFWGGTYFPPRGHHGLPGFRDVLEAIHRLYSEDEERIGRNTAAIWRHMKQSLADPADAERPTLADLAEVSEHVLAAIDKENGGIGAAPKFPSAPMWELLWRAWIRDRDPRMRDAALAWIRALCKGGIYDHLRGGIHRYTVDARWLVPHFEKMLYDNAQFVRSLCTCFAATADELFKERIEETVDFLLTDMRAGNGAFYSSFDADSEGDEGKFYVWSRAEVQTVLGARSALFERVYDVTEAGNWEGTNILNRLSDHVDLSAEERRMLAECRQELLAVRSQRVPPACDDKVLTDWNGLAIRALAEAGTLLERMDWVRAAARAYDFVAESVAADNRLAHAWRGGAIAGPALATDYASMINAAVALHVASGDDAYLSAARSWAEQLDAWHTDQNGGFYLASADRSDLLIRARSDQDDATPAATATCIEALARLAYIAQDAECSIRAESALEAAWGRIKTNPFASAGIVNAADTVLRAPKLLLTGPDTKALRRVALRHPDPARLDLLLTDPTAISRHIGPAQAKKPGEFAYLCRGSTCLPPISDATELDQLLSQPIQA